MDATQYLDAGKHLFFLSQNSKIPPKDYHWQQERPDMFDIEMHDGNLGWALGVDDVVLDIDPRNGGNESFARLCEDLVLSITPTVYTAGGGFHIYMKLPIWMEGFKFKKQQAQYKGIDFLTEGKYVVAAGSTIDGNVYSWADEATKFEQIEIPEALADFYRKLAHGEVGEVEPEMADFMSMVGSGQMSELDVNRLLAKLDPNMGHDEWTSVGMALQNWHPVEGLELWDKWSKNSTKYEEGECEYKWGTFKNTGGITLGTLFHLAKNADYDAVEHFVENIIRTIQVADARTLELDVMPKLLKNPNLTPLFRERLAKILQTRFKVLEGSQPSIAIIRDQITPKAAINRMGEAPEWCNAWIYVNRYGAFLNMVDKQMCKAESFDLQCGIHVPMGERGTKLRASRYVADHGYVESVADAMYLPTVDSDFATIDNRKVYNSFNRASVPTAAKVITPTGKEMIARFERHILMLCNGNEEHATILRQWIAHQVQHMGVKLLWAPVIQSIEGVGKSYIGDLLRACLGLANVGVVKSDQVRSQFNSWATNVCVNVLEELRVQGHNRHEIANGLKPLITDNNVQVNTKGLAQYGALNTTNYICFTNFKDALPLEKGDRRWWIIFVEMEDVDEIEDKFGMPALEYFNDLYETLDHRDQLRRYLLDMEITQEFYNTKRAPSTIYKQAMIDNENGNLEGFDEVREILNGEGAPYVSHNILSSNHLFMYLEERNGDLMISSTDKNRILKKLGYMKLAKRERIDGRQSQLWSKRILSADEIEAFLQANGKK